MMTNSTDIPTVARRERTLTRWIIAAIVVALVLVVLRSAAMGGTTSAEDRFVDDLRQEHPALSVSVASDDELIAVARSACSPEGISGSDTSWLERRGLDAEAFVDDAQVLCPTR